MATDPYQEWQRLTDHYAQMLDGELVALGRQYSELTETAKQVLRDEILKRGLGDPLDPKTLQQAPGQFRFDRGVELNGADDGEGKAALAYTWKTELCECDTNEQAYQIRLVLDRAGIESWVDDRRYLDLINIRIQVAADQLEEARAIIAQPIPQDIIEESKIKAPEYTLPRCPGCGDPDPVLLETEPANRWSCETCGKEWTDAEAFPDERA